MYKILVVDDSALVRKFTCDIINSLEGFTTEQGGSTDGLNAYDLIRRSQFDCVAMNMSMAGCDGFEIFEKLRAVGNKTPIVAIGSSVREDRELVERALDLGAVDFVVRPIKFKGAEKEAFIQRLQEALQAGVHGHLIRNKSNAMHKPALSPQKRAIMRSFDLWAIASSTGGPQALQTLFSGLPADLGVPVVVVQHMPVGFTASLAERIDTRSKIMVKEAENDEPLKPNIAYIAPGGRHLQIVEKQKGKMTCRVYDDPPVNNLRPCADVMFESLIRCSYSHILCTVLTGMGQDGCDGINRLRRRKNLYVVTQNEESCVVYGMPKAVYESGNSDESVHINEMANTIIKELGV